MKGEDLLKAIGEIDEKFIEEASVQIKSSTVNSDEISENTEVQNIIKLSEAKPKNVFKISTAIAACLCLAVTAAFVIFSFAKPSVQSDNGVSKPNVAGNGKGEKSEENSHINYFASNPDGTPVFTNNVTSDEEIKEETSPAPQVSKSAETSEVVTSNTEPSVSEESSHYAESSDVSAPEPDPDTVPDPNEITTVSTKISSSDVQAITAGMTYQEIINQLGETANFGYHGLRQYIVDDELILVLRFDNLTDVCTETGEDLLRSAVSYKAPERISEQLSAKDTIYGIVIDDGFIVCVDDKYSDCYYLGLADADIKFENGESATENDISLMSGVIVTFDMVAESYPPQAHCTSVIIIDSPYV